MKNIGIKIILIILVCIQIALGVKSMLIFQTILEKVPSSQISSIDQAIIIAFLIITLIITIIFILFLLSKPDSQTTSEMDIVAKTEVKDRNEQKLLREEEKKRIQQLNEKKKLTLIELTKDLTPNEDLQKYSEKVLINISKQFSIMQGLFFIKDQQDKVYRKVGTYAYYNEEDLREFTEDIGLSGQVAANKKLLNISNIPDKYITVLSGLGHSSPANLVIFPILYNNETIGIVELASFVKFDSFAEEVFMEFSLHIGNQLAEINKEKLSAEN